MRPRVILSNAISLNGALTGYTVDYCRYYPQLLAFRPDAVLVGADTVLAAPGAIPPEEAGDRHRRHQGPDEDRPWLVVVDSRGRLAPVLHFFRSMEYTRDIIVLVSERTPEQYLQYLAEREYEHVVAGSDRVDLGSAMEVLMREYGVRTLVSDTGGTLGTVLLESGLVDEVSLVVAPVLSGETDVLLYKTSKGKNIDLNLKQCTALGDGYVHLWYEVVA